MAQQLYDIKVGARARGEHHHETPIRKRRKKNGNNKPMVFSSLHHHSTFSYKDGFQLPEAHVRRAAELQMSSIAMTEHGNVSSHVKFEMACDKVGGVKPIFGWRKAHQAGGRFASTCTTSGTAIQGCFRSKLLHRSPSVP
jgi:hypothetical protein